MYWQPWSLSWMAPGLGWRRPKAIASTALASAWSARSPIAQPTICLAFAAQGLPQTFRAVGFAGLDMQLLDPLQQTGIQAYFTAAPTQSTPPHFFDLVLFIQTRVRAREHGQFVPAGRAAAAGKRLVALLLSVLRPFIGRLRGMPNSRAIAAAGLSAAVSRRTASCLNSAVNR